MQKYNEKQKVTKMITPFNISCKWLYSNKINENISGKNFFQKIKHRNLFLELMNVIGQYTFLRRCSSDH